MGNEQRVIQAQFIAVRSSTVRTSGTEIYGTGLSQKRAEGQERGSDFERSGSPSVSTTRTCRPRLRSHRVIRRQCVFSVWFGAFANYLALIFTAGTSISGGVLVYLFMDSNGSATAQSNLNVLDDHISGSMHTPFPQLY